MSRTSREDLYEQTLAEAQGSLVDLRVDWLSEVDGERLLSVGGVWDRGVKNWTGDEATRALVLRIHPGQLEAATYMARWYRAWMAGELLLDKKGREVHSMLLAGGRRSGKTDLMIDGGITWAVMVPGARCWFVSPAQPETEELDEDITGKLPREWVVTELGAPWFRRTLVNGSTIHLRSAHEPAKLKRGRADWVGMNEAQNQTKKAYFTCRGATADNAGLLVMAANPPDTEEGMWVMDYAEEVDSGRRPGRRFLLDPKKNPHIHLASLLDLEHEMDPRTFAIEVRGEFLPSIDAVFHQFSETENMALPPTLSSSNVTTEFLKKRISNQREWECLVGIDLQRYPWVCAVVYKFFVNPLGGEPLAWVVDELVIDQGDENDMCDELEKRGYDRQRTLLILDASGFYQDIERTKGRGSSEVFMQRGWIWCYRPDPDMLKNPDVMERLKVANSRMRSVVVDPVTLEIQAYRRHWFVSPECIYTIRSCKYWKNKNGIPNKKSDFAHVGDALSYPLWHLYPRKVEKTKVELETIEQGSRRDEMEGY
jgi:hypothetical protein